MFDIAPSELMIVALVGIVLIGPKDLPRVMRTVGQWVAKGRAMMRHVHGAVDEIVREAEMQESVQKWQVENERMMAEHATDLAGTATDGTTPAGVVPATERSALAVARG